MIEWNATKEECQIISKIVDRAREIDNSTGTETLFDGMLLTMDIEAVHCNGTPIKLQELLSADDSNFAHDVFGIRRHIDRTTGKLLDCFSPRFSA